MNKLRQLRQFKSEEIILDKDECIVVLKFFFKPADHELIDSLPVNEHLRAFAQALLVEAIDASYAIGFVEAVFRASANPTAQAAEIIRKFAKQAALHWFRHAKTRDLLRINVYEFVVDYLAVHFRKFLYDALAKGQASYPTYSLIDYVKPRYSARLVAWS